VIWDRQDEGAAALSEGLMNICGQGLWGQNSQLSSFFFVWFFFFSPPVSYRVKGMCHFAAAKSALCCTAISSVCQLLSVDKENDLPGGIFLGQQPHTEMEMDRWTTL